MDNTKEYSHFKMFKEGDYWYVRVGTFAEFKMKSKKTATVLVFYVLTLME